ncbi:unnamed protein product [Miscanthus lutarioriparius]|uniref:Uncharacterized protein n=1 Tax=Miscanthus lutarioriparius TaxID=422564 RepID=A0A811PS00_9POAL|nr:unnamed protein product [Miscanthus lutarioriparius]
MATFVKRSSSQGLLLLALLLLTFSVIPAPISGQSTEEARRGRKDDIFNGCHYNQNVHDTDIFCCSKDNQCWSQLTECVKNCPCKVGCSPPASSR